jgi:transcriptional regulator with XRE-family HTH domain
MSILDANQLLMKMLIDARRGVSLTQAEVAEVLGRPQSFVSKYEQGERRLDVVEFVQVCRAIGVDSVPILMAIRDAYAENNRTTWK